jgi:hypothetical protein
VNLVGKTLHSFLAFLGPKNKSMRSEASKKQGLTVYTIVDKTVMVSQNIPLQDSYPFCISVQCLIIAKLRPPSEMKKKKLFKKNCYSSIPSNLPFLAL